MSMMTLTLSSELESSLLSGHPWVYRNHLPRHPLQGGEWVRIQSGRAVAYGLYDAHSPIAIRVFGLEDPKGGMFLPKNLIPQRVKQALDLRSLLFDERTNAYRLISGESDFLPGITADRYDRFVVIQTYAEALEGLLPGVVKALTHESRRWKGILRRIEGELHTLWGELPPPQLTVTENGIRIIANLFEGQKTGLFLDHRDNRALIERFSKNRRVLNLFGYTGAFSLYAARGGAHSVTSVDIAPAAMEDARRNFILNGFDPTDHQFVTADCFTLLENYVKEGQKFDLVILDPPSLARSKDNRYAAARAYKKLNLLALKCVEEGGLLATASCTSQISAEHFKEILGEVSRDAKRSLQILQDNGQAPDHPVSGSFPEGRYLKFILARVL